MSDRDEGCGFLRPRSVIISNSTYICRDYINERLNVFNEDRQQGSAGLCDLTGNMREIIKSSASNNDTYYQTQLGWKSRDNQARVTEIGALMNTGYRSPDLGARLIRVKVERN